MPKTMTNFHPSEEVAGELIDGLITDRVLNFDKDTANVTRMQTYAPGWKAGAHSHDYWEEVLVLKGRIFDETLNRWVEPGEYACRPPGQVHGPMEAGPEGATVLLINTSSWGK
ncbi:hypothetical protein Q8F55_003235 [Vanrija albida]|uniref:ChrR-like cupin domain-containing protein n=1 Tax=Vanrija albida TaxID=181172 RepID=A0ABR3QBY9_9TREE